MKPADRTPKKAKAARPGAASDAPRLTPEEAKRQLDLVVPIAGEQVPASAERRAPLEIHELALALPEMLTDEYIDLVKDIKANGLRQPLMMFEGKVLDGRHRSKACAELGIAPKTEDFTGTAEEAKAYVLSLNFHRRHLTLEQKQRIIATELKRDPSQSDRSIARKAKVDHKTVTAARTKAVGRGEIPHVAERSDTRGRMQPAKKPSSPTKPATAGLNPAPVIPGEPNQSAIVVPMQPNPVTAKVNAYFVAQAARKARAAKKPDAPAPNEAQQGKAEKTLTSKVLALKDGDLLRIAVMCARQLLKRPALKKRFAEADAATLARFIEVLELEVAKVEEKLKGLGLKSSKGARKRTTSDGFLRDAEGTPTAMLL